MRAVFSRKGSSDAFDVLELDRCRHGEPEPTESGCPGTHGASISLQDTSDTASVSAALPGLDTASAAGWPLESSIFPEALDCELNSAAAARPWPLEAPTHPLPHRDSVHGPRVERLFPCLGNTSVPKTPKPQTVLVFRHRHLCGRIL
jgi:hypothetical protein